MSEIPIENFDIAMLDAKLAAVVKRLEKLEEEHAYNNSRILWQYNRVATKIRELHNIFSEDATNTGYQNNKEGTR